MSGLKILAIDDSLVARSLIKQALTDHPSIQEVTVAASGRIAVRRLPEIRPDVVLLDLEMDGMDGLETLQRLLEIDPELAVLLFAAESEFGEQKAMTALQRGARGYVTKPSGMVDADSSRAFIRKELLPRILDILPGKKAAPGRPAHGAEGRASGGDSFPTGPGAMPEVRVPDLNFRELDGIPLDARQRIDILAIGVSTGGPNALAKFFETLPGNLPVPVLIVQHMPQGFTKQLAQRLDRITALHVREAVGGEVIAPGDVLVAPGGHHMVLTDSGNGPTIALNDGPLEHGCRPAVDPMMRSVAEIYRSHVLGLILTGMGADGSGGCFAIRKAGGVVMAQDEASSVVWGMPGFATNAGYCARVLPLNELGLAVGLRIMKGR